MCSGRGSGPARDHGARYLVGCRSITTQDPAVGAAAYRQLLVHLALPAWRTQPEPGFACPLETVAAPGPRIPPLLSAYLALGSAICDPPALDREFKTVDFLVWVDLAVSLVRGAQQRIHWANMPR